MVSENQSTGPEELGKNPPGKRAFSVPAENPVTDAVAQDQALAENTDIVRTDLSPAWSLSLSLCLCLSIEGASPGGEERKLVELTSP